MYRRRYGHRHVRRALDRFRTPPAGRGAPQRDCATRAALLRSATVDPLLPLELNLEARYYTDPAIFDRERRGLLSGSWQLLGAASRVAEPGQYVAENVAGIQVLAVRGNDGQLRAFRNVCRHRGARLVELGHGRLKHIRCPYHCWTYRTDGSLANAPWFGDAPGFDPSDWSLESIGVATWRGLLFVSLAPMESLQSQLGATPDELSDVPVESFEHCRRVRLSFDANWKIYTDNFVEGYHIPGIHPAFYAAIDFEQFRTSAGDNLVKMTAPPRDGLFYQGRWYWMWPNWTLSLFQGGMNTSRINPLAADRTELIYDFYFSSNGGPDESARSDTIARNLDVVREDFSICLETHNNYVSGGYQPGPLSPRHEAGVQWFQQRYRDSIEA